MLEREVGRIKSIQVGMPCQYGTEGAADVLDQPWVSATVKRPVSGPVMLYPTNLAGDAQADQVNHGGPDKAVLAYSHLHYTSWEHDLAMENLPFGAFGENFTVSGAAEPDVCVGDTYRLGPSLVQVSQPRQPCWKQARRWHIRELPALIQQSGRTGWYLRVLEPGQIEGNLPFELLERPFPEWTIARANSVMHDHSRNVDEALSLAACSLLSQSWRDALRKRADKSQIGA